MEFGMLMRQTASRSLNADQRVHDKNKYWEVTQQKDENDPCILDCNQGLALGDFICKIHKPFGKDIIIRKYLEQCIVHKDKPNTW